MTVEIMGMKCNSYKCRGGKWGIKLANTVVENQSGNFCVLQFQWECDPLIINIGIQRPLSSGNRQNPSHQKY